MANTIAVDDLAMQGARASAAMMLAWILPYMITTPVLLL